jgi:hypothetical protein
MGGLEKLSANTTTELKAIEEMIDRLGTKAGDAWVERRKEFCPPEPEPEPEPELVSPELNPPGEDGPVALGGGTAEEPVIGPDGQPLPVTDQPKARKTLTLVHSPELTKPVVIIHVSPQNPGVVIGQDALISVVNAGDRA